MSLVFSKRRIFCYSFFALHNLRVSAALVGCLLVLFVYNKAFAYNSASNLAKAIENIKREVDKLNHASSKEIVKTAQKPNSAVNISHANQMQKNNIQDTKTISYHSDFYVGGSHNHFFIEKTQISAHRSPHFLQNIDLLYKMGYLPIKPISVNNQTNIVTWQWDADFVPKQLAMLTPKNNNSILYKGAIDAFLHQSNIGLDSYNLNKLLREVYNHGTFKIKKTFTWVLVSQKQPEILKAWQNGQWIIETNVNTGVDNTTPNGSFIIHSRYRFYPMGGIFPITHKYYFDKKVPYVNFIIDHLIAIHGFLRYSYGYPQSAGCIELPINNAKRLYKILYIGAVVTIVN